MENFRLRVFRAAAEELLLTRSPVTQQVKARNAAILKDRYVGTNFAYCSPILKP
jgi:hypothetical protein